MIILESQNQIERADSLFDRVSFIIDETRNKIAYSVNHAMVEAYWKIGKEIIEEEQHGDQRAEYGKSIIDNLSKELTKKYAKGYSTRNLWVIRQFYLTYQILHSLRAELSWTHYRLLLKIDNKDKRAFYEIECIKNNWSTRELDRQINSLLYERLALSKNKENVLELAKEGQVIATPDELVKDPYVLEFLGLKETGKMYEKDLEDALIIHLQQFLLELGRGFSFVARQKRITLEDDHFYIDLVFYNYILKCFVLIDLKIGKITHQDLGQMQMYVNYYKRDMMNKGDTEPIGIVLGADKNDTVVKYTLSEDNKQIFASRYKLYLPTEEELKVEILREKHFIDMHKDTEKALSVNDKEGSTL